MKSVTQCRTAVTTTDIRQRRQPERLWVAKIDEAGNRKVRLVKSTTHVTDRICVGECTARQWVEGRRGIDATTGGVRESYKLAKDELARPSIGARQAGRCTTYEMGEG
jgi:hypothetical protein